MTPPLVRCGLLLAVGCGYHDTPVATYSAALPDASGATAGSGGDLNAVEAGTGGLGLAGEAGVPPVLPACMQTYPTAPDGLTSRYKEVVIGQTWAVAESDCESEGAHLIVIDDDAENTWLTAFAEKSVTDSASSNQLSWLGIGDHETEGVFVWVTGAPLSLAPWADMEPNSRGDIEDCVEIRATGEWNDDRCNAKLSYVCECDATPPVGTWCDTDTTATCGDCSTSCAPEQSCVQQKCQ